MKRRVGAVVIVVGIAALAIWLWRGHDPSCVSPSARGADSRADSAAAAGATGRRLSVASLAAHGSLSGSVHDAKGAALGGATVCAAIESASLPTAVTRTPACTHTDSEGRYQIANLFAAEYAVQAAARPYRFETYMPGNQHGHAAFWLATGEARGGVDFVLRHPGVEVTGTVLDITGGPIAHAQVHGSALARHSTGPVVETNARGRFSLWVEPGTISLDASAGGYTRRTTLGHAPGNFELQLTPESTLAGTVIDAGTGQPVAGARVHVSGSDQEAETDGIDLTDARGAFRVGGLTPGRFTATAHSGQGYGQSSGSTLLGLGQHVDGLVIKLFPAHRISGAIVIGDAGAPCPHGSVTLRDAAHERYTETRQDRDQQVAEGVRSGDYSVEVSCTGYLARETYEPIVVASADVTGRIWRVDPGATIRGKVLSKSGGPIADVQLVASDLHLGHGKTTVALATSDLDGSFELTGLAAGDHVLTVTTDQAAASTSGIELTVAAGATLQHAIVLDDGGVLAGIVVDDTGAPVAGMQIDANAASRDNTLIALYAMFDKIKSAADGTFTIDGLPAANYHVIAHNDTFDSLSGLGHAPDDKRGEQVAVRAGQTSTVRLVVERKRGTITGRVIDAAGQPIPDAFVAWSRESDPLIGMWGGAQVTRSGWTDQRPIVTSTDGTFRLTGLAADTYTLRAYRRGSGEAITEHVAVGSVATLQIKPTGSLAGTAHRTSGPPDELTVKVANRKTGFDRQESFYMTDGRFAMPDLPAGHFEITARGEHSQQIIELDLGEGEARTIDVTLEPTSSIDDIDNLTPDMQAEK